MKLMSIFVASALMMCGLVQAQEDASSMDALLQMIERGQARDSEEARTREARLRRPEMSSKIC